MRHVTKLASLAVAVAMAMSLVVPSRAAAWSNGACPTSAGVTVVVDFGALGGGVVTRCVVDLPGSGLAALADAGFAVTPVTTQPAFVCRIDGLPGASAESCATTPPATASWSYWTAARGGAWRYSPIGAAASRPVAGTVEGWRFVTGGTPTPPGVPSPALTPPTPRPTPQPTAPPTTPPTARPAAAATPRPTAAAATTSPKPAATEQATATASDVPTPAPTSEPPEPASPSAQAEAPAPGAGVPPAEPGPFGTLLGIGAIALVGGAAVVARRRFERTDG